MTKKYLFLLSFLLLMQCASKEEEVYTPVPYTLKIPTLFANKLIAPIIAPAAIFRHKKRLTIACKPLLYMAPRPGLEPGTH